MLAEVMAPIVNTLTRSDESTGVVSFIVPPSEQDAEYFEILLYNATNRTTFDEVYNVMIMDHYNELILNMVSKQALLSDVMRTNNQLVTIPNLDACSAYFVRVTAVNCGTRITSDAMLLDLHDTSFFSMTVSIPSTFDTCVSWISSITIANVQSALNSTSLQRCGYLAPCFTDSNLTCIKGENSKAIFK